MGSGNSLTDKDKELMDKFLKDGDVATHDFVKLADVQFKLFLFEAVIRPSDKALVLHVKHLPVKFRNPKFFEYVTLYFKDRIGKYKSCHSSFIGEFSGNKLNSLDLIFVDYYPAKMNDLEYIKTHSFKIANDLHDTIIRELSL